jgi:hypothetical protein
MHHFVKTRRAELNGVTAEEGQGGDIFSRLVAAMELDSSTKLGLEEQEVVSNLTTSGCPFADVLALDREHVCPHVCRPWYVLNQPYPSIFDFTL